jgi:hypothetical protein
MPPNDPKANSQSLVVPGYVIFDADPDDPSDSDEAFRRSAWQMLMMMGLHNPIETHAFLFEPALSPVPAAQAVECLSPSALRELDLGALGLEWIDGAAIQSHIPLSYFSMSGLAPAFTGPVLCDPYYGVAIAELDGAWRNAPFVMEQIFRRIDRTGAGHELIGNLSLALSDGVRSAYVLLRHLFEGEAAERLAALEIPEIEIGSLHELESWNRRIAEALSVTRNGARLWFRGQPREYWMPDRSAAVKAGFLQHSEIRDPSLVSSVYRNVAPLRSGGGAYRKFLQDVIAWQNAARAIFGEDFKEAPLDTAFEDNAVGGGMEFGTHTVMMDDSGNVVEERSRHYHRQYSYWQRNLLLQHYGCPTPFIDITSSTAVALWFATHQFAPEEGRLFAPAVWNADDPEDWPRIYGFILAPDMHPAVDSRLLDRERLSLRARRQSCGLLGAGGLLARNYAARYISVKFRLNPTLCRPSNMPEEFLFPKAGDDLVYRLLRERKDIQADNQFPLYGL